MRIQSINAKPQISLKGLYFTKTPNVIFNTNTEINYVTKDVVDFSKQGFKYIKDRVISQEVKDKFHFIPFTRELSDKGDTFIFFQEMPKNNINNITGTFFSFAKILWLDYSTGQSKCRTVSGNSNDSQEEATQNLFRHLMEKDFHELRIR